MSLDALETLSKFTSPLLIPLPPSPPPIVRVESRKPEGWVSVLPRLGSGRFVSLAKERNVTGRTQSVVEETRERGVGEEGSGLDGGGDWGVEGEALGPKGGSAADRRTPGTSHRIPSFGAPYRSPTSGPRRPSGVPLGGGKRVISGTMQYALLPPVPPSASTLGSPHPIGLPSTTHERAHSPSSPSRSAQHHPAPPSTASPRSEHLQTPLPGLDFHVPPPPPPSHPPAHNPELPSSTHGSEEGDTAVYHIGEGDNDHDTSFRSMSEVDSAPGEPADAGEGESGDEEEGGERDHGWIGEVLAEREADEEWMGYVRGQLNALFPDFFAGIHHPPHLPSYYQPPSTVTRTSSPFRHVESGQQWDYPVDPVLAGRAAVDSLPLPGVRSELGDLREEIERLRGVVGDLAQGLTAARAGEVEGVKKGGAKGVEVDVKPEAAEAEEVEVERMMLLDEDEGDRGDKGTRSVSELLHENAEEIIHLLRVLDLHLNPTQNREKGVEALLGKKNLKAMTRQIQLPDVHIVGKGDSVVAEGYI